MGGYCHGEANPLEKEEEAAYRAIRQKDKIELEPYWHPKAKKKPERRKRQKATEDQKHRAGRSKEKTKGITGGRNTAEL